ncbi:FAD-dependent monooxygenase [Aliiroseovarius sp. YM-037]|uniref:FAD-dependent monooxygenase n=1 Tax=Aliiroseovarius sp. YM-037 TaxID=3341728 RepID=UPI003A7FFA9C
MSIDGRKITVLGAGIGGLTAAIALAQRGARVTVLDQAEKIKEVGAGLQVSPNGVAVLKALGLGEKLAEIGVRAEAVALLNGRDGQGVFGLDLMAMEGAGPYYFVHRADLIAMLHIAAHDAGVTLRLLHQITKIDLTDDGGAVWQTAQGAKGNADILIGADGVRSITRGVLNEPRTPYFTRHVAWRAIVPARGDEPEVATVFMGPKRHMVTYPLRGGTQMNIVAVEERTEWTDEGWWHKDDPQNMRAAFAGFCPDATALLNRVEEVHLWGLFRHPVAERWHRGRVALLGDAVHPTLPFLAQGAVMAMEDAWVLADSLANAEDVESGLTRYQHRRHRRAERVVAAASKNAQNYHISFPPYRAFAHGLLRATERFAPGLALKKFDWLYSYDVTKA